MSMYMRTAVSTARTKTDLPAMCINTAFLPSRQHIGDLVNDGLQVCLRELPDGQWQTKNTYIGNSPWCMAWSP
uniref:Uncharacterized protein n=1 Tax=Arundo donax TaxID=35708 RepID=A0A0A9A306_ARUDO